MSAQRYLTEAAALVNRLQTTQVGAIEKAAEAAAQAIATGHVCHLFGSGHSILPVMDIFPRYGSFVGFHPLTDPRLMWTNVIGPGGAPELLWIERAEGYVANFLDGHDIRSGDVMVVYSHGGLNAAPVEAALYARAKGCTVVAVTSLANAERARATHSSGKRLVDLADVVIDNCVPPEDALVRVEGLREPVAAGSTVAVVLVSMALVAETARRLAAQGVKLDIFVSPNVEPDPEHNRNVFRRHVAFMRR